VKKKDGKEKGTLRHQESDDAQTQTRKEIEGAGQRKRDNEIRSAGEASRARREKAETDIKIHEENKHELLGFAQIDCDVGLYVLAYNVHF